MVVSGTRPAHAQSQARLRDFYKPGLNLKPLQMKQNQNITIPVSLHGIYIHMCVYTHNVAQFVLLADYIC